MATVRGDDRPRGMSEAMRRAEWPISLRARPLVASVGAAGRDEAPAASKTASGADMARGGAIEIVMGVERTADGRWQVCGSDGSVHEGPFFTRRAAEAWAAENGDHGVGLRSQTLVECPHCGNDLLLNEAGDGSVSVEKVDMAEAINDDLSDRDMHSTIERASPRQKRIMLAMLLGDGA